MSLFGFIKGLCCSTQKSAADNAVKQYKKAMSHGVSQKDVFGMLFATRYSRAYLDEEDKQRFSQYIDSDFSFETIADFCMATLDIELNINKRENFAKYSNAILKMPAMINSQGVQCSPYEFKRFGEKWEKKIAPYR